MSDQTRPVIALTVGWADLGGKQGVCVSVVMDDGNSHTSVFSPTVARAMAMQLLIVADTIDRAASSPRDADTAGPAAAADGGAGDSQGRD